jgi:acyl carrier protein
MITKDAFIHIVRDELKLPLSNPDLESEFDQVVNWKSVHLVRLLIKVEARTGRRVPVSRLLRERTTEGIYALFAAAA